MSAFENELRKQVSEIVRGGWARRDGEKVPEPSDLGLSNDGVDIEAAVLYADLNGSTALVDSKTATFAAEVYKIYLLCAARIIRAEGGAITAYDGDRIMAIFIGGEKRTTAVRTALKINYAVSMILNPALKEFYTTTAANFTLRHVVGVDCSKLLVARIGIRNDNDLVWVGRAANYAAKLTELNDKHPVFITEDVFNNMLDSSKYGGSPAQLMWEKRQWTSMGNMTIYSSNWTWKL